MNHEALEGRGPEHRGLTPHGAGKFAVCRQPQIKNEPMIHALAEEARLIPSAPAHRRG